MSSYVRARQAQEESFAYGTKSKNPSPVHYFCLSFRSVS